MARLLIVPALIPLKPAAPETIMDSKLVLQMPIPMMAYLRLMPIAVIIRVPAAQASIKTSIAIIIMVFHFQQAQRLTVLK